MSLSPPGIHQGSADYNLLPVLYSSQAQNYFYIFLKIKATTQNTHTHQRTHTHWCTHTTHLYINVYSPIAAITITQIECLKSSQICYLTILELRSLQ